MADERPLQPLHTRPVTERHVRLQAVDARLQVLVAVRHRSGRLLIRLGGGRRSSIGGSMRWRRTWWSGAWEALWKFVFGTALIDLLQKGAGLLVCEEVCGFCSQRINQSVQK